MGISAIKPKKIGIDARFYGPLGKGLGRYTQEIVDNVISLDRDDSYVIFLCKENFGYFKITDSRVKKVLATPRWYSLAEQIIMPWLIWREHLDLMHFPHFNVPVMCQTKFVVTIHDLILTKFPTTRATTLGPILYKIKNLGYRLTIWLALKRAEKIIAVSDFTKRDLVETFRIDPGKIVVTYEGIANLGAGKAAEEGNDKKTLLGYNIDSSYLLYVGNAYPHKNLDGLIRIFSKVKEKKPDLKLVLVGKEDYFYQRVKIYAAEHGMWQEGNKYGAVVFPGYVPDEDLDIVFKNARAYVFSSLYEGFGLPPLEAMSKGCPVVSSDKASMPEILGDSAVYFNPENEAEAAAKIISVLDDEVLRSGLKEKGYRQAAKYDWEKCAEKTLDLYKNIA